MLRRPPRWRCGASWRRWRSGAAGGAGEAGSGSGTTGFAPAGRLAGPPRGWPRRCRPTRQGRRAQRARRCWSFPRACEAEFPQSSPCSAYWNPPRSHAQGWWWWQTRLGQLSTAEKEVRKDEKRGKKIWSNRHRKTWFNKQLLVDVMRQQDTEWWQLSWHKGTWI